MSGAPIRFQNVLVVANPIAGRGRGESYARELEGMIRGKGSACDVRTTTRRGEAAQIAAAVPPGVDLVVSVGGDGTLSEVLTGLAGRDVVVGLLPLGTANVLSLDLRLPRDVAGFESMLVHGRVQRVDTALVNGQLLSFLVCGIGFDASVVRALEARRRGPITRLDWLRAGLTAFARWRTPRLSVEIDGEKIAGEFGQVLVSNIVHYAGFDVLDHARELDDGRFEVYTFDVRTRAGLLGLLVRGMVGRFPCRGVGMRSGRRVGVTAPEPAPVEIDGDFRAETPFELVVGSQPFRILVPSPAPRP